MMNPGCPGSWIDQNFERKPAYKHSLIYEHYVQQISKITLGSTRVERTRPDTLEDLFVLMICPSRLASHS